MRTFSRIFLYREKITTLVLVLTILTSLASATGCKSVLERQDVRPLVLRDVPAQRLAFRFEPDIGPPANKNNDEDKLATIQSDFNTRRPNDALLRTIKSPDGQRALVLYGTEDQPSSNFRIDMYASDGKFLKNLTPPTLSCVFPEAVAWSPDGNAVTFIAHKKNEPSPTPTPPGPLVPETEPLPVASPSVAPAFPNVPVFATEQIYVCNRDGYDLRALTTREGLIYFYFAWAPDNHALVALACKEDEWDHRERQRMLPAGRPRLVMPDGSERLLDDRLTQALPVWSPDSSKVATGFEGENDLDVSIYDAATTRPTQARVPLRDAMIAASIKYEQKTSNKDSSQPVSGSLNNGPPPSYNPIVTLDWVSPDKIYFQTAYVRFMKSETINTFPRWHRLILSPQAAVLK
jgi:Tol biopolymer transport system component